jgi:hypothetical protein
MFIYWYILKNEQIINIHTERKKQDSSLDMSVYRGFLHYNFKKNG